MEEKAVLVCPLCGCQAAAAMVYHEQRHCSVALQPTGMSTGWRLASMHSSLVYQLSFLCIAVSKSPTFGPELLRCKPGVGQCSGSTDSLGTFA